MLIDVKLLNVIPCSYRPTVLKNNFSFRVVTVSLQYPQSTQPNENRSEDIKYQIFLILNPKYDQCVLKMFTALLSLTILEKESDLFGGQKLAS